MTPEDERLSTRVNALTQDLIALESVLDHLATLLLRVINQVHNAESALIPLIKGLDDAVQQLQEDDGR